MRLAVREDKNKNASSKKFYKYNGPVIDAYSHFIIDRTPRPYIRAAVSRNQAFILLRQAIAADRHENWKDFYLDDHYLFEIEDPSKPTTLVEPSEEHLACPLCGTRLNDGGVRPVCDDGEEDY